MAPILVMLFRKLLSLLWRPDVENEVLVVLASKLWGSLGFWSLLAIGGIPWLIGTSL